MPCFPCAIDEALVALTSATKNHRTQTPSECRVVADGEVNFFFKLGRGLHVGLHRLRGGRSPSKIGNHSVCCRRPRDVESAGKGPQPLSSRRLATVRSATSSLARDLSAGRLLAGGDAFVFGTRLGPPGVSRVQVVSLRSSQARRVAETRRRRPRGRTYRETFGRLARGGSGTRMLVRRLYSR